MLVESTRPTNGANPNFAGWILRLAPVVVALVGAWLLLQSASLGLSGAEAFVAERNSMHSEQFFRLIDAQTAAYRLVGAVLLGVGTARALLYIK
jgi:hypothetical protein